MSGRSLYNYRLIQTLTAPPAEDAGLAAGYMRMTEFDLDLPSAYGRMMAEPDLAIVPTIVMYDGESHVVYMLVSQAAFLEANERFQEWADAGMPCNRDEGDDVFFKASLEKLDLSWNSSPPVVTWWAIEGDVAWALDEKYLVHFILHGYTPPQFG